MDTEKLDKIIALIERWFASGPNRNPNTLAKYSGANSQTIRRILQKESVPELETALCILNTVASYEETLEILEHNDTFSDFIRKSSNAQGGKKKVDADDVGQQLYNRERFWSYALAITVGVTREKIINLCGSFGAFELDKMIDEGLLVEKIPGVYVPNVDQTTVVISNKEIYSKTPGYICEVAMTQEGSQKVFMLYNVTETDYFTIKDTLYNAYSKCEEIARASHGPIVMASTIVTTIVRTQS